MTNKTEPTALEMLSYVLTSERFKAELGPSGAPYLHVSESRITAIKNRVEREQAARDERDAKIREIAFNLEQNPELAQNLGQAPQDILDLLDGGAK